MIYISGRYVKPHPDGARDPRHAQAGSAHRVRREEGDRHVDPLLLVSELRADLPGAEAAPQGRPRQRKAGAPRAGEADGLLADAEGRACAARVADRQRERGLRAARRGIAPALLRRRPLGGRGTGEHADAAADSSNWCWLGSGSSKSSRATGSPSQGSAIPISRCATASTSSPGRATGTRKRRAGSRRASR